MNTRLATRTLLICSCGFFMSCDTNITNPGRINDEFLKVKAAQPALVNGAGRAIAQGLNWVAYTGAAVAREIHPAGSTGNFGITPAWQSGMLASNDLALNSHWNETQRGRWLAENAIAIVEPDPINVATLAQAYLWAGYAHRILGDNMCEAVFDGSAPMPNAEYFKRAENHFTKAAAIATDTVRTAALAGRAQARAMLGMWSEAVADARQVPTSFVYNMPYYDIGDEPQKNRIYWSVSNSTFRAHTMWNTWIRTYADSSGDPRVPYKTTTMMGDAAIACCGLVPWYPQMKYVGPASPIRLASGREMRLIEAESQLRGGDYAAAMSTMNVARHQAAAGTITARSLTEAWTLLKRERGIELWIEARRLGDLRRWKEGNTPGSLSALEVPGTASHLTQQDLCFPVPPSERDTNPRIPRQMTSAQRSNTPL